MTKPLIQTALLPLTWGGSSGQLFAREWCIAQSKVGRVRPGEARLLGTKPKWLPGNRGSTGRTRPTLVVLPVGILLMALCQMIVFGQTTPDRQAKVSPPAKEYRAFALVHEGDVSRGRALFNDEQRSACVKCHSIDGTSSKAGPDLFAIGDKFPRSELIRAVLEPSAEIAIGYGTTIVVTKSGDEVQGIVKQATDDAIELIGADAKRVA